MFRQPVGSCWRGCIHIDIGLGPNGIISRRNVIVAAFARGSPFGILSRRNVVVAAFAHGSGHDVWIIASIHDVAVILLDCGCAW